MTGLEGGFVVDQKESMRRRWGTGTDHECRVWSTLDLAWGGEEGIVGPVMPHSVGPFGSRQHKKRGSGIGGSFGGLSCRWASAASTDAPASQPDSCALARSSVKFSPGKFGQTGPPPPPPENFRRD